MQPKVGPMGGHLELSWAHVGPQMGYVRLILGHLEVFWAHVGLRMGYVRLMLGYLLGHLFGTNVCHIACWSCDVPNVTPNAQDEPNIAHV